MTIKLDSAISILRPRSGLSRRSDDYQALNHRGPATAISQIVVVPPGQAQRRRGPARTPTFRARGANPASVHSSGAPISNVHPFDGLDVGRVEQLVIAFVVMVSQSNECKGHAYDEHR